MVQSFAAAVAKWVEINSEEAYLYETGFFCNYISKCFLKNFVYISCSLKINKQISEIISLASKKMSKFLHLLELMLLGGKRNKKILA